MRKLNTIVGVLVSVMALVMGMVPPVEGNSSFAFISSPDWEIELNDAGYSDFMWQEFPDQEGHENLSGEWAAAIRYDGISTPGAVSMWLTPEFIYPDFTTNSTFWTEDSISTWDDPTNATEGNDTGYSKISNEVVAIEISYTMHDTGGGVAAGLRPGGVGLIQPAMSGRYVLQITYQVTNISGDPLTNIRFFQFLHGQPNDDYDPNNYGVYDPTQYALGAFPEYHYDITQYGASIWNPPGSDIVGFSSADPPTAWGIGDFPGHEDGEPATGLHLDIYNDTLPLTTSGGPAEIAGAMMWDCGTLLPDESFSKSVLLYNGYTSVEIPPPGMTEVGIDIKPGSFPNSINLRSRGNIPVAILSDSSFDATTLDRTTVLFAGASPLPIGKSPKDVNRDGLLDVVLHFKTRELDLQSGDIEACLSGETLSGHEFVGCDSVRIVR